MTNTNMRRGFTMIELIFVIVIIGILAAVAIPKLAGTATEAKKATIESFMGTLNRTVGPAMWAENVGSNGGSVKTVSDIKRYTELPTGVSLDLSQCADANSTTGADIGDVNTDALPVAEDIYCIDGSSVAAPRFGFDANMSQTLKNN